MLKNLTTIGGRDRPLCRLSQLAPVAHGSEANICPETTPRFWIDSPDTGLGAGGGRTPNQRASPGLIAATPDEGTSAQQHFFGLETPRDPAEYRDILIMPPEGLFQLEVAVHGCCVAFKKGDLVLAALFAMLLSAAEQPSKAAALPDLVMGFRGG